MRNAGLEEAQAGIKIAGRNINNLIYADGATHMADSEEELKSLLMKVKVESEKVGLKLNQHSENEDHGIWSHHFTQLCSRGSPLRLGTPISCAPGSPRIGIQWAQRRGADGNLEDVLSVCLD